MKTKITISPGRLLIIPKFLDSETLGCEEEPTCSGLLFRGGRESERVGELQRDVQILRLPGH